MSKMRWFTPSSAKSPRRQGVPDLTPPVEPAGEDAASPVRESPGLFTGAGDRDPGAPAGDAAGRHRQRDCVPVRAPGRAADSPADGDPAPGGAAEPAPAAPGDTPPPAEPAERPTPTADDAPATPPPATDAPATPATADPAGSHGADRAPAPAPAPEPTGGIADTTPETTLSRRLDVLNEVLRGQAAELTALGERTARSRVTPAVRILAELHELLLADAGAAEGGVAEDLDYYRGLVEDALDSLGVVARAAEPGAPVDPRRHRVLRLLDVEDPDLDRTIAAGPVRHSYEFDGADPVAVVVKAKITAHRLRRGDAAPKNEATPDDKD